MRNVGFDSHWHTLKINENFQVDMNREVAAVVGMCTTESIYT